MSAQSNALVSFDASYYVYPTSICRGYWARYPIETGLSYADREGRQRWLAAVMENSKTEFHGMVFKAFSDLFDTELMRVLLERHGLYIERFFHKSIREHVARRLAETQVDLPEFEKVLSLAWGHEHHIPDWSEAIYRTVDHIFEQVLVNVISDSQVYRKLEGWYDEFSKLRPCALCGKDFRVIDLPDWVYFGSNGVTSCCFQCRMMESPKKRELETLVPAFVKSCGFIPESGAGPINYAFTSRLAGDQWLKVFPAFARMGGIDHVKAKYGSWFKALAETRALPNGVLITARGVRCLAQDGHACHSLDEQHIDDWLSTHGLDHEREPIYPSHPVFNPAGKRRADWKVGDIFVEYFGLVGDPSYEKKMDEKILLAQYLKIDMIAVYPSDLGNIDGRLGHLLK